MRVRRLGRTSTGVKPIVAVSRGRRVPTGGGDGGGSDATAIAAAAAVAVAAAAAAARHQLLPVGSASTVPGPFLAGALPLGRTTRSSLVLLYLFIVLQHHCF